MYQLAREEVLSPATQIGLSNSTLGLSNHQVVKLNEGPAFPQAPEAIQNFWEFLHSWGGNWVWEGINSNQNTKSNTTWLAEGMTNSSLIWVTDGSYNRKKAQDLSNVRWIILCTRTGKRLMGTFWEKSTGTNLYHAEMLGLCALHLLAQALAEFYKVVKWSAILCCNNKHALELSSHHRHRIRPSAKCANIYQNLRAIKQSFTSTFKYIHVYGHMDRYLEWEQLSLIQKLNCVCDMLNVQSQKLLSTATTAGSPSYSLKKMSH